MEYFITSKNNSYTIDLKDSTGSVVSVNGEEYQLDIQKTKTGFHIIHNGKGISVDIVELNKQEKTVVLKIESEYLLYPNKFTFTIKRPEAS